MKIALKDTEVHDLKDFIAKFYVTKKDGEDFNALLVDCKTRHYKTKLKNAVRMYFVIEGNGEFVVDNEKYEANLHDYFLIKSGQIYEYSGKMKLIEVNIPSTDRSNEEEII